MSGDPTPRPLRAVAVPAALTAAGAVTLGVSYTLPTVTFRTLTSKAPEVYSIWGGIVSLWRDGNVVLAPVVFLFSIAFPVVKLCLLAWVLATGTRRRSDPRRLLAALRTLGKWSMLDVWIVGLFVGAIRIGLATASSLPGIHTFAAAIVLSMLAAISLERAWRGPEAAPEPRPGPRPPWERALALAAAGALALALAYPLLVVSKGFLFRNEVALWSTARRMAASDERLLGYGILALVALVPIARAAASVAEAFTRDGRGRWRRAAVGLFEWGMVDVLALALLIVHVKLDELATTDLAPGYGWTLAAALATVLDAARVARRRSARPGDRGPTTAPGNPAVSP